MEDIITKKIIELCHTIPELKVEMLNTANGTTQGGFNDFKQNISFKKTAIFKAHNHYIFIKLFRQF